MSEIDTPVIVGREAALANPSAFAASIASEDGALVLIDKPYGVTSFDIVNRLRKSVSLVTGIRRVKCGHAGTLDPLATGLLILGTRRKTRALASLVGLEKTYDLRMRFGVTSPSYDLERPIEIVGGGEHLTEEIVRAAIEALPGEHSQVPPVFSAIKQRGKPVYKLARAGEEPTLQSRTIFVHKVEIVSIDLPHVSFRVRVSKGTYIRSLVRDLAASLGTGGLLVDLRRESVGNWGISDALSVEEAVNLTKHIATEFQAVQ